QSSRAGRSYSGRRRLSPYLPPHCVLRQIAPVAAAQRQARDRGLQDGFSERATTRTSDSTRRRDGRARGGRLCACRNAWFPAAAVFPGVSNQAVLIAAQHRVSSYSVGAPLVGAPFPDRAATRAAPTYLAPMRVIGDFAPFSRRLRPLRRRQQ